MPPFILSRTTVWAQHLNTAYAAALVVLAACVVWENWIIAGVRDGARPAAALETSDAVVPKIILTYLTVALAAFMVNAIWIYRSTANANALYPTNAQITAGWAVGWFFVPIAHLFKPYQALSQTYRKSHRMAETDPMARWFAIFWAAWIISSIVDQIANRMFDGDLTRYAQSNNLMTFISSFLGLYTTVMLMRFIRVVDSAQSEGTGIEDVFA